MNEEGGPVSKVDEIFDLLAAEGPLSTHQITERLNNRGILINGNGQTLHRLRLLLRRGRVVQIEGDRPDWKKWKVV
jgi:hypothetical protein